MNTRNLKQFEKRLKDWLEDLLCQADRTMRDLKDVDFHPTDEMDQAVEESSVSFSLRIRNRENRLIRKIQRSIRDIHEGTYGVCEMCGEAIGLKRLKARPVTRHCIQCKTDLERMERLTGT